MAIRTAKAVVEEVPSAAQSSVASLAACRENNSERDTGRVAKRFGLKLPIPLSRVQLGSDEIPFLKMSDWATFILQAHLWHRLCGLTDRDQQRCCDIWQSFWTRYRKDCQMSQHRWGARKCSDIQIQNHTLSHLILTSKFPANVCIPAAPRL